MTMAQQSDNSSPKTQGEQLPSVDKTEDHPDPPPDDLTVPEAADLVARRLKYLGVDEALRDAGAAPGDDVQIGDLVFTYEEPDGELTDGEEDAATTLRG